MPSVNLISFQTVKNGHTYYSTWKKFTIKDKYTVPGMDLNLKYIKQDQLQVLTAHWKYATDNSFT